jgi:hypothetical protein
MPQCRQISPIVPRFGPEPLVLSDGSAQGDAVFRTYPLLTKLLTQLAPAVAVTAVGILMLSNLSKPVDVAPAGPAESAITTEAVFTPLPQRAADNEQSQAKPSGTAARAAAKPKATTAPARKLASIEPAPLPEPVSPPLQIVPPEPPRDATMMGKLRGVGTTVRQMPQRAYATVTGWFAETEPPRPPAPVPTGNFL